MRFLIIAVAVGFVIGAMSGRLDAAPTPDSSKGSPEQDAKAKLKEAREVLIEAIDAHMERMKMDPQHVMIVGCGFAVRDVRELAKVTLELYDDKGERVKGLTECVKLAEKLQERTEEWLKAGTIAKADALDAKALALQLQAQLLREEGKRDK